MGCFRVSWLNLFGIAVGLAMDAFAVSIAAGLTIDGVTSRHVFRIAFHFGLFQFMMPILGWLVGSTISTQVVAYGHWLAFALLGIIGGKMLLDARSGAGRKASADPSRGWMLVALSLATSIDALAVGLSMACLQVSVWLPCVVIGFVAALFSTVGISFAGRILHRWGRAADLVGGCILILIGIRIVVARHG
jgi:putative Mn2+ efflux pump MntP